MQQASPQLIDKKEIAKNVKLKKEKSIKNAVHNLVNRVVVLAPFYKRKY
jgi:hypothetical protein